MSPKVASIFTLMVVVCLLGLLQPATAAAADLTTTPATAPASTGLIKVGVTVSKWTADTNSPSAKPWGYGVQTRIIPELRAADIDFYPVIESGSQTDPALLQQLKTFFPNHPPIEGSNADALKQLDVLVAHEDWMVPAEFLAGVDQAVSDGLPLLNIGGMGWARPGLHGSNAPAQRLTGLLLAQGGYSDGMVECEILTDHPILGSLADRKTISLKPLGAYGVLPDDATPLIKVIDPAAVKTRGQPIDEISYPYYPLYVSHLGNGKIIGLTFAPFKSLNNVERRSLLHRSLHYLASRPVD
jgi:hypothetical protein